MKRMDYYWPSFSLKITGIFLIGQLLVEVVGQRKHGYEWVLPLAIFLFSISVVWSICIILYNVQVRENEARNKVNLEEES